MPGSAGRSKFNKNKTNENISFEAQLSPRLVISLLNFCESEKCCENFAPNESAQWHLPSCRCPWPLLRIRRVCAVWGLPPLSAAPASMQRFLAPACACMCACTFGINSLLFIALDACFSYPQGHVTNTTTHHTTPQPYQTRTNPLSYHTQFPTGTDLDCPYLPSRTHRANFHLALFPIFCAQNILPLGQKLCWLFLSQVRSL